MGVIAQDDACDAAYASSWSTGSNGGFGFGAWVLDTTSAAYAIGDSTTNGTVAGTSINCGSTKSWELYCTGAPNEAQAFRAFPRDSTTGDYFCLLFDVSNFNLASNSQRVVICRNSIADYRSIFYLDFADGHFKLSDAVGVWDSGLLVGGGGSVALQWHWLGGGAYEFTVIRLWDNATTTATARSFSDPLANGLPSNAFAALTSETGSSVPLRSEFINSAIYADSSGGYSGCAGDPHFVDFDGNRFDFHSIGKYLIWENKSLKVEAVFDLEEKTLNLPGWAGTTCIMKIAVTQNGNTKVYKAYDDLSTLTREIDQKSGLSRGVVKALEFIGGDCLGGHLIEFDGGRLVISAYDAGCGVQHLNISFVLDKPFITATGILGQTTLPTYLRKPNESFLITA